MLNLTRLLLRVIELESVPELGQESLLEDAKPITGPITTIIGL